MKKTKQTQKNEQDIVNIEYKKRLIWSVIIFVFIFIVIYLVSTKNTKISNKEIFENNLECQKFSWELNQKYVEREYPYEIKEIFYSPTKNECLAVLYNNFYSGEWYAYTIVSVLWEEQAYFSYNYTYWEASILSDFSWKKCYWEEKSCQITNPGDLENSFNEELKWLKNI